MPKELYLYFKTKTALKKTTIVNRYASDVAAICTKSRVFITKVPNSQQLG